MDGIEKPTVVAATVDCAGDLCSTPFNTTHIIADHEHGKQYAFLRGQVYQIARTPPFLGGAESEESMARKKGRHKAHYELRDFEVANRDSKESRSYGRITESMQKTAIWKALTPTARLVYLYLKTKYRWGDPETESRAVSATDRQIAEGAGLGINSVVRGLRQLEDFGFIECVSKGGYNGQQKKPSEYKLTASWIVRNGEMVRSKGISVSAEK